jgi:hypothetical protein
VAVIASDKERDPKPELDGEEGLERDNVCPLFNMKCVMLCLSINTGNDRNKVTDDHAIFGNSF